MCMYSHPMRLDVWFLVGPSVYFPTLCVWTANAVIRLRGCAGFPEPSLVAWAFAGRQCNKYHNLMSWLIWRIWLHFLRPKKKMPCFWKPYLDVSKRFRKNGNQCRPWSDLLQDVGLHCLPRPVRHSFKGQYEPCHEKTWFMSYANNKGTEQPAHPCSWISTFVFCCLDSIIPLVSISEISSL